MYVGEGNNGANFARVFRSDSVRTGVPVFTDLTSSDPANPGYGSFDYCRGQCWYDNFVLTPDGHPDIVYLGGSYQYNENDPFPSGGANPPWVSNGRGVVLSQDAGVSFTDMSIRLHGLAASFWIASGSPFAGDCSRKPVPVF